jgi:flavin-dependent thymidylate synthase
MRPEINDPHLSANLCKYASSPNWVKAIWMHQHVCVADTTDWTHDRVPSRAGMINAILIELGRGHWDVLAGAFAQIQFEGYPHDTAMQFRTHQDMGTLTASMRYTGERLMICSIDREGISQQFYLGKDTEWEPYASTILSYRAAVNKGIKKEVARRRLASGYRQGWSCAGTLKDWLHLLDRRLLGDTQDEARHAAWAAFDQLREWCPEIMDWYAESRAGKNKLAP